MLRGPLGHKLADHARACLLGGALVLLHSGLLQADELLGGHPVDGALKALNLKTDPGQAPDFVKASRPKTEGDFLPIGTKHVDRTIKVKSPAELKAMEAELDAARIRHDKIAGRKPPPDASPGRKTTLAKTSKPAPPATQN